MRIMNSTMLSDKIENFILEMLKSQESDALLLKRKDVADRLACAPSQVTYVINTRFSGNDRFIVESRRGSGGYIKIALRSITRAPQAALPPGMVKENKSNSQSKVNDNSVDAIERSLRGYFQMLLDYDIVSEREYRLLYAMMHTMLAYCPESQRKEAARTMIHRIEWALKGE